MAGGSRVLGIEEQFLIELLARPGTAEPDLDVAHLEARQADEVVGQVHDLERLAHVQHEYLAALADGPGLQHQLHRLRDGHEIAAHLRVGNRERTALADLPEEGRHHAPTAAQHVAEPHRDEVLPLLFRDLLHDLLGDPLGGAHDVGGPHRLVGRDQHKVLDTEFGGQLGHVACAQHVVRHRLGAVGLHERDMLVSRCMEDREGREALEHVLHTLPVPDVRDDRARRSRSGQAEPVRGKCRRSSSRHGPA